MSRDHARRRPVRHLGGILARSLAGAAAGVVATGAMTAWLAVPKLGGALGEPPPRKLTRKLLGRLGLDVSGAPLEVVTALSHLAYGAVCGVGYALLTPPSRSGAARGAAFGTAVWAASYAGWIPKVGLMPPPQADRPGRPTSMVVAHLVFGAALGRVYRRLAVVRPARSRTTAAIV